MRILDTDKINWKEVEETHGKRSEQIVDCEMLIENQSELITAEDLETLCICALRYCQGRRSYMPGLVQQIVKSLLPDLSDRALSVILRDCEERKSFGLSTEIDEPGWLAFEKAVSEEVHLRENS